MDGEARRERRGAGELLRASARAALATGLLFALAALLAMQLVEPAYVARAIVETAGPIANQPERPSSLSALVATPAFASAVVSRLGDETQASPASSLPRRIVEILEGTPVREALRETDRGIAESVSVERGGAAGEIAVVASAGSSQAARDLANAVAAELVDWIGAQTQPASDDRALRVDEARAELASLQVRLAELGSETEVAEIEEQLSEQGRHIEELSGSLAAARERVAFLLELQSDPATMRSPDILEDDALARRIEAYRRLDAATDDLRRSLLDGNPRRRIAEARLAELGQEVSAAATDAARTADDERAAIARDLAAGQDETARLEAELTRAQGRASARAELSAQIEAARSRLSDIEVEEAMPPEPPARMSAASEAPPAPLPILLVTALAGLIGLAVGGAGGALAASVVPARPPIVFAPAPSRPASERSGVPQSRQEHMSLAEIAAGLTASPVSRVLAAPAVDHVGAPASLTLARMLASKGNLVLLVDLSRGQAAARASGAQSPASGFSEIAQGRVGLAAAVVADEDSGADIIALGGGEAGIELPSRAGLEALHYARKAYDQVIVDCGAMPGADVLAFADAECAVLVPSAGIAEAATADRLRELAAAGLEAVVLTG